MTGQPRPRGKSYRQQLREFNAAKREAAIRGEAAMSAKKIDPAMTASVEEPDEPKRLMPKPPPRVYTCAECGRMLTSRRGSVVCFDCAYRGVYGSDEQSG